MRSRTILDGMHSTDTRIRLFLNSTVIVLKCAHCFLVFFSSSGSCPFVSAVVMACARSFLLCVWANNAVHNHLPRTSPARAENHEKYMSVKQPTKCGSTTSKEKTRELWNHTVRKWTLFLETLTANFSKLALLKNKREQKTELETIEEHLVLINAELHVRSLCEANGKHSVHNQCDPKMTLHFKILVLF